MFLIIFNWTYCSRWRNTYF